MKKQQPHKKSNRGEITFSPEFVEETILVGLKMAGYLPEGYDGHFEVRPYRCGSEKNHQLGVKIVIK